jgi:hypothetical protein
MAAVTLPILLIGGCLLPSAVGATSDRGPTRTAETVRARATDSYTLRFFAGEVARVSAVGAGDIDLYVYDENGRLIVVDQDADPLPIVEWVPRWTGRFTIKVKNCEHRAVDYVLLTN